MSPLTTTKFLPSCGVHGAHMSSVQNNSRMTHRGCKTYAVFGQNRALQHCPHENVSFTFTPKNHVLKRQSEMMNWYVMKDNTHTYIHTYIRTYIHTYTLYRVLGRLARWAAGAGSNFARCHYNSNVVCTVMQSITHPPKPQTPQCLAHLTTIHSSVLRLQQCKCTHDEELQHSPPSHTTARCSSA